MLGRARCVCERGTAVLSRVEWSIGETETDRLLSTLGSRLARGLLRFGHPRASGSLSPSRLADAAVDVTAAVEEVAKKPGLFDQLVMLVERSLCGIHDVLAAAHVPGAYGLAIIGFTLAVKVVTFPLNYKQMESSMKMQALQPRMKAIQGEFRDNPQMANQAIAQLYKDEKINPLAGLLPVFAQIPIFISLYRALLNLAQENQLDESFLFLPSLQGPVSQPGATLKDWLFPFVNGSPPVGWHDAAAYLVIPIALVALQVVSQKLLQPPAQDEAAQKANGFLKFLPLLIGWFSLNVPSGLGVYWVTNTAFSTLQTLAIRKKFDAEAVAVGAGGGGGAIGGAQEKGGVATRIVSKADGFSSSSNGAGSASGEGGSGVQTTVRKAKKPGQKRRRK